MHETNCVILDSQICLLCICQAFEPIAKVANEIVKKNGFGDKISVIGKRSTELSMEEGKQSRANLLVTELWDTELIGEGALPTLRDACNRLLEV